MDQQAATDQQAAVVDANAAQVDAAQDNVDDTIVYAPFSGKLNVDDVAVGTYATAGSTALVTISTTNPVYVEFTLSESEYLQMSKQAGEDGSNWGDHLYLRLSMVLHILMKAILHRLTMVWMALLDPSS